MHSLSPSSCPGECIIIGGEVWLREVGDACLNVLPWEKELSPRASSWRVLLPLSNCLKVGATSAAVPALSARQ